MRICIGLKRTYHFSFVVFIETGVCDIHAFNIRAEYLYFLRCSVFAILLNCSVLRKYTGVVQITINDGERGESEREGNPRLIRCSVFSLLLLLFIYIFCFCC